MNPGSPKGKGLGAPVAALLVAILIVAAVIVYASFSPRQAASTSSSIATTSATPASTSYPSSTETSSTSRVVSTATSSSSSGVTIFQSMPTSSAPQPQVGVLDPSDGDTYVANSDNGSVSVISNATSAVVAVLRVGNSSSSLLPPVLDPTNGELYVALSGGDGVAVVSGETVVSTVLVGGTPSTPFFDPQNNDVYVPFYSSADFVSVISGATNTVIANITTGAQYFVGRAFDPTNGDIYLTSENSQGAGLVLIIGGDTNTLVGSVVLDFATCNFAPRPLTQFAPCTQDGPTSPVFDSASGDVYVSNGGGDTVSVISGATNSLIANIGVGGGPMTPTVDSANGDVYIANSESNSVSVISSVKNVVVANLTVGDQPFQAVLNPMNGDIYVPSFTQDSCGAGVCVINSTLSIISGATNTVVATVPLCMDPIGTTVDSSDGDVYVSCQDGTNWVVSSTTVQSPTTSTQRLGEILPECGTPFNTLLNPAPKGTVYLKVVTGQGGTVVTNWTLLVTQAGSFGSMTYCISMSDVNGTGYIQLAPVSFNGSRGGDFITSGYYNVTLWVGSDNPNVTNNPPPSYLATIPSIQIGPDSTVYVTVSVPSGAVTVDTANEGSSAVTTTTSATTTKVSIP